jgi:hypothetical protein
MRSKLFFSRIPFAALALVLAAALWACGGDNTLAPQASGAPDDTTGVLTVSPVPIEAIWSITPLGSNNKIIPVRHTYWDVCDLAIPASCPTEKLTLLAPGPGVVAFLDSAEDGRLMVIGPRGYGWHFGHVTPLVKVDDTIHAGQAVARMHYIHGFDFEAVRVNDTLREGVANPGRFQVQPPVHPISLYPDSLRARLTRLVPMQEEVADTLGRAFRDVPGTAMGAWFLPDAPSDNLLSPDGAPYVAYFGRFSLRPSMAIANIGGPWPEMQTPLLATPGAVWDTITPTSGPVATQAWGIFPKTGLANPEFPHGTFLLQMLSADTLRVEWFATHDVPAGFTDSARVYVR